LIEQKPLNLLLIFTTDISLKIWDNHGILTREIELYKRLTNRRVNISLLTYGDKSDLIFSNYLENINIIPIKKSVKKKHFTFLRTLSFLIRKWRLFKNINIIKTNQMRGSWVSWVFKLFFRKKIVIRCGYELYKLSLFDYENKLHNRRSKFKLILLYLVELFSYRLADHIIITNQAEKNFIMNTFGIQSTKISIIPNYIDTNVFQPILTNKFKKRILFIGSLNRFKNLENLIQSLNYIKDFSLDIIGLGELKPFLSEKIRNLNLQERVSFLGIYPNSELPRIINKYQIFILPSISEGNPKVLLEAMSCGLACIGSNISGITQIIKHKKNGYICDTDSDSIAKAIHRVSQDSTLSKKIGQNARNYIIKNHSLDLIVKKELELYRSKVI